METTELLRLLRPLRRWWWFVLLATVLAAFASLTYTLRQPDIYRSRTTLMVGSTMRDLNPNGTDIYLVQQLAQTYAEIAMREPIQLATMAELGMDWLPDYWVQALPNSQIMEVQVYAQDPILARDVAAVLAQQLILLSPAGGEQQEREDFIDAQLSELQQGITDTKNEIWQRQQELAGLFSARQIADTQSLIGTLESKLISLQANYAALVATTQQSASNTLNILEPANLPTAPLPSDLPQNVVAAALLGFVLAAGGIYFVEFLDDSFRTAGEVQELLDAPILTSVPKLGSDKEDERLVMLQTTPTSGMEAFRLLRINLEFASIEKPNQLLVVVGASAQDGKSLTTANLASAYARAGNRVILIDADLHRPSQQRLFGLTNNRGLTTALRNDELALETLLQPTPIPGLQLLASGPLPPNPAELLGSKRMKKILTQLKEMADLIVIDSPPLTTVTDGLVLATQADGVLMVVRANKTRRAHAKHAYGLLSQIQVPLLGIVYNGVAVKGGQYWSDYSYQRYREYRTAQSASKNPQAEPDNNGTTANANGVPIFQKMSNRPTPDIG